MHLLFVVVGTTPLHAFFCFFGGLDLALFHHIIGVPGMMGYGHSPRYTAVSNSKQTVMFRTGQFIYVEQC